MEAALVDECGNVDECLRMDGDSAFYARLEPRDYRPPPREACTSAFLSFLNNMILIIKLIRVQCKRTLDAHTANVSLLSLSRMPRRRPGSKALPAGNCEQKGLRVWARGVRILGHWGAAQQRRPHRRKPQVRSATWQHPATRRANAQQVVIKNWWQSEVCG